MKIPLGKAADTYRARLGRGRKPALHYLAVIGKLKIQYLHALGRATMLGEW